MKRALLVALLALAPGSGAAAQQKVPAGLYWRGELHPLDRLPAGLESGARAAVLAFGSWAAERSYRLDLEERQRVLLISPAEGARLERLLELEQGTLALFEELLPAPVRTQREPSAPAAPTPAPSRPGELPEDPEEGPAGAGLARTRAQPASSWGNANRAPDSEPALLFVLRDERAQAELVDTLAQRFESLGTWAQTAREQLGFVLEQPLAGAFVLAARDLEEWHPDNELVHRLAELLLLRRFGRQPHWVAQGFAWLVEERLCGAIYCFPYRAEFVWATEHRGWDLELTRRFQGQSGPVKLAELTAWKRGTYVDAAARLSFGLWRYLARAHAPALPALLEELRAFRDRDDRVTHEDGSWSRSPDYEIPQAELERMLFAACGKDLLSKAAAWFRAGLPAATEQRREGS